MTPYLMIPDPYLIPVWLFHALFSVRQVSFLISAQKPSQRDTTRDIYI
jgi:hypothetical protein